MPKAATNDVKVVQVGTQQEVEVTQFSLIQDGSEQVLIGSQTKGQQRELGALEFSSLSYFDDNDASESELSSDCSVDSLKDSEDGKIWEIGQLAG